MKIIEALKSCQDLARKAEDLRNKIKTYCADMDHESPVYGTPEQQKAKVDEWLQAHSDVLKEISRLQVAIQKTNLNTNVVIEIGGKQVTKNIQEWILRRRLLSKLDLAAYECLSDKNLPAVGSIKATTGEIKETKIRRYFDPSRRDELRELYRSEPSIIDGRLEVVNAVTDLLS